MNESIMLVLNYFSQFSYPPTEQEIHTFLSKKNKKISMADNLQKLVDKNIVFKRNINGENRYALSTFPHICNEASSKLQYGEILFKAAVFALRPLGIIPTVSYLGISGSLSMKCISSESDIDVFVITKSGAIWQTRFILLLYKHLLKVCVPRIGKKLCFNLFFAEDGLTLRKEKQTEYIGHEILQLQGIINQNNIHEALLVKNRWIVNYFPNVHILTANNQKIKGSKHQSKRIILLELLFKRVQTWWLDRKGYAYSDSGNQLWLIQKDYEDELV